MNGTVFIGLVFSVLLLGCPVENVDPAFGKLAPVCTTEGETYVNAQIAELAGKEIAYEGVCCGESLEPVCEEEVELEEEEEAGCTGPALADIDTGVRDTVTGLHWSTNEMTEVADDCASETTIRQYYCQTDGVHFNVLTAGCGLNNVCEDGVCVEIACVDSDDGVNIKTAGMVVYEGNQYKDYCDQNNNQYVTEYYCENGVVASTYADCGKGNTCSNGACT